MKKLFTALTLSLLLAGCSLIPKQVEFGQRKVKEFPIASAKLQETQREAAEMANRKAKETLEAATEEAASPAVTAPAQDTADLTAVVSESLGPPSARWDKETQALVQRLEHQIAGLNAKVDKFAKTNDQDAGKKIEGTGWLQIPYFVYAGGVFVLLFIGFIALKIFGGIAAASNPGVAVGMSVLKAGGGFASSMAGQLIKGGENFKTAVANKLPGVEDHIKDMVLELFQNEHMKAQSPEVQAAVQQLTKN